MNSANRPFFRTRELPHQVSPTLRLLAALLVIVGFASGIGFAASPGVTQVTVLSSSTANDRIQQFYLTFNRIDLISQSGKAVPLLLEPLNAEFVHVNGSAEPLATAPVPQDRYTGVAISLGPSSFTCDYLASAGGLSSHTFAQGHVPAGNVSVDAPSPIVVGSASLLLRINLAVLKSARFSSCSQPASQKYSIDPTFEVTAAELSPKPTNIMDGKLTSIQGMVNATDLSNRSFQAIAADGPNCPANRWAKCPDPAYGPQWQFRVDEQTAIRGLGGFSSLLPGMPVDIDAEIQPDGSLLATRIDVHDANTSNLSVSWGPTGFISNAEPMLAEFETEALGFLGPFSGFPYFSFGKAEFRTSGQFTNLRDLPFPAAFTASNLVPGQNVSITSHSPEIFDPPIYIAAKTVTLMPQILNGRILSMGKSGGFDTYAIQLAGYDLFPAFAHQPGLTTLLQRPGRVVVYVGDSTEMLNSDALHVGSIARFTGLVFNDRGTLRMDCAQILDGVNE
jgi:hypothetical protein